MAPKLGRRKVVITDKLKQDPLREREIPDLKKDIEELYKNKFKKTDSVTPKELWTGAQLAKNFGKHDFDIEEDEGGDSNDEAQDKLDEEEGGRPSFNPSISESDLLTTRERKALGIQESLKFWREPKDLLVTLISCCVASLTQGWDQVANGNLGWPHDLKLQVNPDGTGDDIWLFGLANGITWFAAATIGCVVVDPICHSRFFGRRGAVILAAMFSFASVIGGSRATSWQGYIISRLFLGIGIGAKASIVPIWESEVLPQAKRGPLLVLWQVFAATGIFAGSVATYIFRSNWRNQVLTGAIPAFLLLILTPLSCESPRWLILQDRYPEAFEVLVKLRKERILAAEELCFVHFQVTNERVALLEDVEPNYAEGHAHLHFSERLFKLTRVGRYARAMLATMIVMLSQQLSGINILAFMASIFFSAAGLHDQPDPNDKAAIQANAYDSLRLTIGFGVANAVFSTIAYFFIEPQNKRVQKKKYYPPPWVLGRRTLLLFSLAAGTIMLAVLAGLLTLPIGDPAKLPTVMLFIMLFTLFYSPGAGAVPFAYSAEVWPNEGREIGMSWAVFWNFLGAGFLALFVPRCLQWGAPKLFGLFSGLSFLGFILVFLYMPATRHAMTLDAMSRKFDKPIREYSAKKLGELKPYKRSEKTPATERKVPPAEDDLKGKEKVETKEANTDTEDTKSGPKTTSDETDKIEPKA